jgi:uncharacterized protein
MDRRSRLDGVLAKLSAHEGVLGAAIVSRDGLCVRAAGRLNLDRETFSAMSATVMGAAEIALGDVEGGRARSVVAATETAKMVVVGATPELLLIAYARVDAQDAPLVRQMQEAAADVAAAVAGG